MQYSGIESLYCYGACFTTGFEMYGEYLIAVRGGTGNALF